MLGARTYLPADVPEQIAAAALDQACPGESVRETHSGGEGELDHG
jgi:hypothetical protein